jgi:hypothetical protein
MELWSSEALGVLPRPVRRNKAALLIYTHFVPKKLTFRIATRSPRYNFDLLLLYKYLSNSDICIHL